MPGRRAAAYVRATVLLCDLQNRGITTRLWNTGMFIAGGEKSAGRKFTEAEVPEPR